MLNIRKPIKKLSERFLRYQGVVYIPGHAHGDDRHEDCEYGFVSVVNEKFIFVKFSKQLGNLGWEETTSQACDPRDLRKISLWWGAPDTLDKLEQYIKQNRNI